MSARARYSDASGRIPDQILVKILDLNLNIQEQQNRSRVTDILQTKELDCSKESQNPGRKFSPNSGKTVLGAGGKATKETQSLNEVHSS